MILHAEAIAAYTEGVIRARREYALNPFAACGVTDCDQLRSRGRMCSRHAGPNYRGKP